MAYSCLCTQYPDEPEKKAPAITVSQLRILLEIVLPLKIFDIQDALDLVEWIQWKNHKAYISHRKKRIRKLSESP